MLTASICSAIFVPVVTHLNLALDFQVHEADVITVLLPSRISWDQTDDVHCVWIIRVRAYPLVCAYPPTEAYDSATADMAYSTISTSFWQLLGSRFVVGFGSSGITLLSMIVINGLSFNT